MKIEINSYPKCECGNDMVPLYTNTKKDRSENEVKGIDETEDLFWKCPKCKEVILNR